MKRFKVLGVFLLLVVIAFAITGCKSKKKELVYDGDNVKVTFEVAKDSKLKISTDAKDKMLANEEAVIIGDGFKIGIEEDGVVDLKNFVGNFARLKESKKDEQEFKEVKFGNAEGFSIYYSSYVSYQVYLDAKNKTVIKLNVYSDDFTESATKKVYKSAVVKELLEGINISTKKTSDK